MESIKQSSISRKEKLVSGRLLIAPVPWSPDLEALEYRYVPSFKMTKIATIKPNETLRGRERSQSIAATLHSFFDQDLEYVGAKEFSLSHDLRSRVRSEEILYKIFDDQHGENHKCSISSEDTSVLEIGGLTTEPPEYKEELQPFRGRSHRHRGTLPPNDIVPSRPDNTAIGPKAEGPATTRRLTRSMTLHLHKSADTNDLLRLTGNDDQATAESTGYDLSVHSSRTATQHQVQFSHSKAAGVTVRSTQRLRYKPKASYKRSTALSGSILRCGNPQSSLSRARPRPRTTSSKPSQTAKPNAIPSFRRQHATLGTRPNSKSTLLSPAKSRRQKQVGFSLSWHLTRKIARRWCEELRWTTRYFLDPITRSIDDMEAAERSIAAFVRTNDRDITSRAKNLLVHIFGKISGEDIMLALELSPYHALSYIEQSLNEVWDHWQKGLEQQDVSQASKIMLKPSDDQKATLKRWKRFMQQQ
ncbi:hypothetical protein LTR86_009660 [Recurvomyces mirabilis]|nr:hypothetical protein LTR86_009660 [Recurvomyces mirabilis]